VILVYPFADFVVKKRETTKLTRAAQRAQHMLLIKYLRQVKEIKYTDYFFVNLV
jgi:hypothetical protein